MKPLELIGQQFGHLIVKARASANRQGNIRWVCDCLACGKKNHVVAGDHLVRKKNAVKSCGCLVFRTGPRMNLVARKGRHSLYWKGVGDISGNWWYCHVLRERKQGDRVRVPVTVTIEYAWELFLRQERRCALSGIPLVILHGRDGTASVDRIDSSRGYEPGNIQWVHKDINFMKRTYSQEYFQYMCALVAATSGGQCEVA